MNIATCCTFLVCILNYAISLNIRKPSVFVVTPAPRSDYNEARSASFYNHNWIRRMGTTQNSSTTTTTTPKTKTPDLIFAEFEPDSGNNMPKSIRKLLEKERVKQITISTTPSTTSQPVYFPDKGSSKEESPIYAVPTEKDESTRSESDYFNMYNNLYNKAPVVIYSPSSTTPTSTTTITQQPPGDIENIWHIINSEKRDQYTGNWKEVPVDSNDQINIDLTKLKHHIGTEKESKTDEDLTNTEFASPGLDTNIGNGAENESRAIRTEPDIRFPYVSLKPFQMKKITKRPVLSDFQNSKKNNNMFTNLDNFKEINNPIRGEAQDIAPIRPAIDRYNPAQPYLPQDNGSKSKQPGPMRIPPKTVANLVPPPPPKSSGDDFPAPPSYDSFPPYAPSSPNAASGPSPPLLNPTVSIYQAPKSPLQSDSYFTQISDDGDSPKNMGNQYKPPSFLPTLPPTSKPFSVYSYKPSSNEDDGLPATNFGGYSYSKPSMTVESSPEMEMDGYSYSKSPEDSSPVTDEKPAFHGYHYNKPTVSEHHHHSPTNYDHESDYPDLIFDKPHASMGDNKGENDMKDSDIGMMPPPPPADMSPDMESGPPMDDHGFPSDFPGDFKFHHDFDDHDFFHHHHHHHTTTTTTTTTESPRENRFSYYYLGKKLYYLPLYFSVYFIVYVGALIIKAVLRHKIVYPNSWRPDGTTNTFFAKRSVDSWDISNENLHEITRRVTKSIAEAAEKYISKKYTTSN